MDDDADKSGAGGDNVRLTIDEQDYDIRSEAGASIDGDDKDKDDKPDDGKSGDADDDATGTALQGTTECLLSFSF